jgi:N6-L-threonylcarbamoyladenine synthase
LVRLIGIHQRTVVSSSDFSERRLVDLTRILGIETSCDETSASVLAGSGDDVEKKSLVILSQDVHRVFGGVVPEIASRAHLTSIVPVVSRALDDAETSLEEIDAIAVTYAPGLIGALLVGVCYAKALGYARGIPVIPIHHMEGHIFATALEDREATPPFTCLLVSGGHTMLLDVEAWGHRERRRCDDAAEPTRIEMAQRGAKVRRPGR